MSDAYQRITADLKKAYDGAVEVRSSREKGESVWKLQERRAFLELLRTEGRRTLLEIGAGTGLCAAFFATQGISVLCTDLSPAMVEHCQARGLEAHCQDVLHLDLGRDFDAVFAMNCLLHVPREDLSPALVAVRDVLVPGGLFYLGQYGGIDKVGVEPGGPYEPPRFFSHLTDQDLLGEAETVFEVVSFHSIDLASADGLHFQSLLLRRPS